MITLSTLQNPNLQCKIYAALRHVVMASQGKIALNGNAHMQHFGATTYIKNRQGNNFIRVDYHRGNGFRFYAAADAQTKCGYEITKTVYESLRA